MSTGHLTHFSQLHRWIFLTVSACKSTKMTKEVEKKNLAVYSFHWLLVFWSFKSKIGKFYNMSKLGRVTDLDKWLTFFS